jgi:hypothetical protein
MPTKETKGGKERSSLGRRSAKAQTARSTRERLSAASPYRMTSSMAWNRSPRRCSVGPTQSQALQVEVLSWLAAPQPSELGLAAYRHDRPPRSFCSDSRFAVPSCLAGGRNDQQWPCSGQQHGQPTQDFCASSDRHRASSARGVTLVNCSSR